MNELLSRPMLVRVDVRYRRDTAEYYELLISPFGGNEVCVRLRDPQLDETTTCQVPAWPNHEHESETVRALHAAVACFFGEVRAVPRIVGMPDWTQVSLVVSRAGEEQRRRRLLSVELSLQSPTRASAARSDGTRYARDEFVQLCREDADAVYAVTRVALCESAARLPDAADEREPALPTHADAALDWPQQTARRRRAAAPHPVSVA
jgi:hypothetical protein